jgi:2-polyprenyl-6-methoxyphenol hydroxylase-like FAD-dependent oxidoreductase
VLDALLRAGASRFDLLAILPPGAAGVTQRGDERFTTIGVRRPALEWVVGRAAESEPGVEVRRGVAVEALLATEYDGCPHVTGVRLAGGEELSGDLVVDAMGRRSPLAAMLAGIGAAPPVEEAEDSGFIYYTRFFRARDGVPRYRSAPLSPLESFTILVLPGDNGTWSVTLYIASGDRTLKSLRHADRWSAVLAACPLHAQWLEGEPLTGVLAMGGVLDRFRSLVVDGRPVATGIVPLADAWACTNPSAGRGIALGLLHARHLRDCVRYHLERPLELTEVFDAATEAELTPWYRATVAEDRARLRQLQAAGNGAAPPSPEGPAAIAAAFPAMAMRDPDLLRAFLDTRCCWATSTEVLARPWVTERILELRADGPPQPLPGPGREELLALVA